MNQSFSQHQSPESPDETVEYQRALVELIANHMVGEALGADALAPHLERCPDLETRFHLTLIMHQEAKHGWLLAKLLKGLGEDPDAHFRRLTQKGLPAYHRIMIEETDWAGVIVGSVLLVDPTGVAFITANIEGNYTPLRDACSVMLREERFHLEFGRREFAKLCQTEAGRAQCQQAIDKYFPITLKILGKPDSPRSLAYQRLGLRKQSAREIIDHYLTLVLPPIREQGLNVPTIELHPLRAEAMVAANGASA